MNMTEPRRKVFCAVFKDKDGADHTIATMADVGQTIAAFELGFRALLDANYPESELLRVYEMSDEDRMKYGFKFPGEATIH